LTTERSLDAYARRARLQPALVCAFPLALSLAPLVDGLSTWWTATGGSLLTWCGGTYLFTQLIRDRGGEIEPILFESWGGPPTTRLLRHRGAANPVAVAHRHAQLRRLLPHLRIPSALEETADPTGADHVYETAVGHLREATRDQKTFPLVFEENSNYGFRRNLLSVRRWGLGAAVAGLALVTGSLLAEFSVWAGGVFLVDAAFLIFYARVLKPSWVKKAADRYAERLLGAADQLP